MPSFNGLIQHSFSLRLAKGHRPFVGPDVRCRLEERFALSARGGSAFEVKAVCEAGAGIGPNGEGRTARMADHSPLVRSGRTSVHPLPIGFSLADGSACDPDLPSAFEWAKSEMTEEDRRQEAPTFVFGATNPKTGKVECNDYLVERSGCEGGVQPISLSLLEILAHKRSRLLGLALANRIVSVLLPHAVLSPVKDACPNESVAEKAWFAQPLVSFVRDSQAETEFRSGYSLTLLLVPIVATGCQQRKMSSAEIDGIVNAGWGLATVPTREKPTRFQVSGPLLEYLPRLVAPFDPATLLRPSGKPREGGCGERPTLRQGTEVLAFCLGLRLAQGSGGRATARTIRRLGDDVVTSLGSARVSSVLVVDGLTREEIRAESKGRALGRHRALLARISRETRPPVRGKHHRKYRLDRAFVDDDTYVAGVVPTNRCLVVSCAGRAQDGWYQSGLMQAGSLAHMTIGAATAIGTLRAIDRDLEKWRTRIPARSRRSTARSLPTYARSTTWTSPARSTGGCTAVSVSVWVLPRITRRSRTRWRRCTARRRRGTRSGRNGS